MCSSDLKAGFVSLRSRLGEVQDRNEPYCEFIRFKDYSKEVLPCPESMIPLVFTNASSVHEGTELGKSLTHYSEVKP